jgi:competence ComEA-like helix-hairpin-helix protein
MPPSGFASSDSPHQADGLPTLEPAVAGETSSPASQQQPVSFDTNLTIKYQPGKAGSLGSAQNAAGDQTVSWRDRLTWPRLWEYALAFALGILALLVVQAAWKQFQPPQPLAASLGSVDLNHADLATLKQLPGVGPHLAARILEYRQQHGPFASVEDLKGVHGIGPVTLERLRTVVFIGPPAAQEPPAEKLVAVAEAKPAENNVNASKKGPAKLVDLNTASKEELIAVPGIGPVMAERILEDRQKNGPFQSVADLTRIKGIKAKTVEKWGPFLKAENKTKPK